MLSLKDLKPGMQLQGTVRNVVDFGAFVDLGVHEDGLVHISRMAKRMVKNPHDLGRLVILRQLGSLTWDVNERLVFWFRWLHQRRLRKERAELLRSFDATGYNSNNEEE